MGPAAFGLMTIMRFLARKANERCLGQPPASGLTVSSARGRGRRRVRRTNRVADGEGFEPSVPCGTHAFQACPIDRSGTHPKRAYEFGVDLSLLQPEIGPANARNEKVDLKV